MFRSPKGQSHGGRTNDSGSSTKLYHTTSQSLEAVGLGCERYEIVGCGSQMRPEAAQTSVGDGHLGGRAREKGRGGRVRAPRAARITVGTVFILPTDQAAVTCKAQSRRYS